MTDSHAPDDLTAFDVPALDAMLYRLSAEALAARTTLDSVGTEIARVRRERDGRLKRSVV